MVLLSIWMLGASSRGLYIDIIILQLRNNNVPAGGIPSHEASINGIFVALDMSENDSQAFVAEKLDGVVQDGSPLRVWFPSSDNTPDEWYAVSDIPRFILVLSGVKPVECCIDGKVDTIELDPGDALYMEPYAWTSPHWNSAHTFLSIVFYHSYLRFLWGRSEGDGVKPPPVHWHTSKGIDPAGFHVLQALNQLAGFPSQRCAGRSLVESLLKLANIEVRASPDASAGKAYQSYRMLCDYLNSHAHEPLNRETVADQLGISPSHISRLFQEQGSASFSHHLLRLRMERAISLLQEHARTIKEVGYYCGYRNDSYFIRTFKSYHGVSPGDWRIRSASG